MEYLIGFILAAVVIAFARLTGFDRDRAYYPIVLIVVATYYILFAAMGASRALLIESLAAALFTVMAVAGFRKNLWFAAAGLAAHGVFDFFHHLLIENPGVPVWWPGFCLAYDVLAGGYLAARLMREMRR